VDPTVTIRPVRPDEREAWIAASAAGYAEAVEQQGGQARNAARAKADADVASALELPGSTLYVVEADGSAVGRLWLAERESGGRRVLFVYDISIDPQHRGRGYARRAMQLAETEARARAAAAVELHVFGANEVARGLYRSLGYAEVSVLMRKDLA
jgi:ribosomal protein S18 acetylase RimI-like enzyme